MLEEQLFEFSRLMHCGLSKAKVSQSNQLHLTFSYPFHPFQNPVRDGWECRLTVDEDVAAADEFAVDVDLGDGGPVRVLLDALAQLLVFEAVERLEQLGLDALHLHHLDHGAREATHGHVRRSLHKDDQRVRLDRRVDLAARLGAERAQRDERGERRRDSAAARRREDRSACWRSSL